MSLLLDSSIFLWWMEGGEKLSAPLLEAIADPDASVAVSVATVWELEIKHRSGKLHLPKDAWTHLAAFDVLRIEVDDAVAAARLPLHHRDPFDRLILAQAMRRDLTVTTSDAAFAAYDVRLLRA